MQQVGQIAAVVDEKIRMEIRQKVEVREIFLFAGAMPSKGGDAVFHQSGDDIVLSGERIAGCYSHFRAARFDDQRQISSLGF